MESFALSLALIMRFKVTRKWPEHINECFLTIFNTGNEMEMVIFLILLEGSVQYLLLQRIRSEHLLPNTKCHMLSCVCKSG